MKARIILALIVLFIIAIPSFADERNGPVGRMTVSAAAVEWQSSGSYDRLVLVVGTPNGTAITREFQGNRATFRIADLAPRIAADGTYVYELRAIAKISDEVKQRLAAARARDDDDAAAKIRAEAGIGEPVLQSGAFSIRNGSFVTDSVEPPANGGKNPKVSANATTPKLTPGANDVVTADDAIIQGSLCVGLDCVNNESFGFDTIRLKENNTRIKFDDTSTSAGFPANDWQLTANDSASGGSSKFSIEDITGAKVPFTVTAGAPTNSMFVASSGKVGLGTSSPVLNLHINTTDTPAIRQEQNNSGGFTAQTWDIGANEANWFVRDVTGGSRLPLRIRPGAPTSSVDISADGDVGVGTASPNANSHFDLFESVQAKARLSLTGQEFFQASNTSTDGVAFILGVNRSNNRQLWIGDTSALTQNTTNQIIRIFPNQGDISALATDGSTPKSLLLNQNGGAIGIACNAPTSQLVIASASGCANPSSSINAGATQFTAASSRTFKENIAPVETKNILDKIEAIPVVTYDFKGNGPKDRMGLIAEDFHTVFERGSDKYIDGQEVQMALWLAVQQLTEKNKELTNRLATLEKQLSSQQKQ
jgi:hypothetical protein